MADNLHIEAGLEELISAEETRRSVQLERGFLLELVSLAAFLVLLGGAVVLFGLHLIQHRVKRFALEAVEIQRGDRFAALEAQQRGLCRQTSRWRHAELLGVAHETFIFFWRWRMRVKRLCTQENKSLSTKALNWLLSWRIKLHIRCQKYRPIKKHNQKYIILANVRNKIQ